MLLVDDSAFPFPKRLVRSAQELHSMKRTAYTWLAFLVMTASVIAADTNTTTLNASLHEFLNQLAESENEKFEPRFILTNDVIVMAGHTIRIAATSERALPTSEKFVSAGRFDVTFDGAKVENLTFNSVGAGESEPDSRKTVVGKRSRTAERLSFGSGL